MIPRLFFAECPATDIVGAIVEAIEAVGPEVAEGAGAAAAGAGVADAAGAFGGAADASAGIGDAALASDASSGLGDLAASGAGAASTEAGLGGLSGAGVGDATASLGANTAGVAGGADSTGGVGAGTATLPEQTVTAASTAPGAAGTGASPIGDLAANIAPIATAGLASAAGGGGSGVAGTQSQPADFGGATASNAPAGLSDVPTLDTGPSTQFLSASDTTPSLQPMGDDLMSQLGISDDQGMSSFDASSVTDNPGYGPMNVADQSASQGIGSWLSNPKNDATLASLGISGLSALRQPKLPAASQTASANATAASKGALSTIQSGGTATPEWSAQMASIDSTINQQIQQQTAAIKQAAANSGEGTQNSGIVQQQIAQMTQNANTQRQQLYAQAQQQNVQNALAELSGGDATLTSIGNMQLQQEERAQQIGAQTAELALKLYGSSGVPGG
jgi:hypothetical protein